MKINESGRVSGIANPYKLQQEMRAEQFGTKRRKDEVQISPEAKEMLQSSQLNQAERSKHIEQLKQSVASGTYHVEAGKIAEKLLPYLRS
ncbi:flagellar biosynthesis anti-sigma factor FlgM [Paenibacillus yanchengensis]|uniref:Negative regulator of flagellin synthesis n=1 Tax=Paenibacillus yanchengensis TaxID=2035833 RepID=A0ABW4YNE0_9BACL